MHSPVRRSILGIVIGVLYTCTFCRYVFLEWKHTKNHEKPFLLSPLSSISLLRKKKVNKQMFRFIDEHLSSFSPRKSVDIICNCTSFLSLNFYIGIDQQDLIFSFFSTSIASFQLYTLFFVSFILCRITILVRNRRDGIDPMAFNVVTFFFFFVFERVFFFLYQCCVFFFVHFFLSYSFFFPFCQEHIYFFFLKCPEMNKIFFIASRFFLYTVRVSIFLNNFQQYVFYQFFIKNTLFISRTNDVYLIKN